MNIVEKARTFAIAAHAAIDQKRKYTGVPYTAHCENVVNIVKSVPHTEEMLSAAWLHDVVEDTKVSIELIKQEFGEDIADLVEWLTDVSRPEMGNRATRKAIDRDHIARAPADAQTIKLADLIDNRSDIIQHDKDFGKVYIKEAALSLDVLTKGNMALRIALDSVIERNQE